MTHALQQGRLGGVNFGGTELRHDFEAVDLGSVFLSQAVSLDGAAQNQGTGNESIQLALQSVDPYLC